MSFKFCRYAETKRVLLQGLQFMSKTFYSQIEVAV